jgi:hypothetical protein
MFSEVPDQAKPELFGEHAQVKKDSTHSRSEVVMLVPLSGWCHRRPNRAL